MAGQAASDRGEAQAQKIQEDIDSHALQRQHVGTRPAESSKEGPLTPNTQSGGIRHGAGTTQPRDLSQSLSLQLN